MNQRMKAQRRLGFIFGLLALFTVPATAALTLLEWRADTTTTPWSICVYTSKTVCRQLIAVNPLTNAVGFLPKDFPANPRLYGAVGDATTNDAPAFTAAAVAACAANSGGTGVVAYGVPPNAGWKFTTSLSFSGANCPQGAVLKGPGKFLPGIVVNNQSVDVIQGSINNLTLKDVGITGFGTPTAGIGIDIDGENLTLDEVMLTGLWWGFKTGPGATNVQLRNVWMRNIALIGGQIGGGGAAITNINSFFYEGGTMVPYAALQFISGGAVTANNVQIFGALNCIDFEPVATPVATADFTGSSIDHCTNGLQSTPSGTGGVVQRISFTGGKITSHSGVGVNILGNTQGVQLSNVGFFDNQIPISVSGGGNDGLTVGGPSLFAGNRGPVTIGAGQGNFAFNGNLMGPYAGFPNNVGCLTVAAGASDWYSIANNICKSGGARTSGIVDGGTGTNKNVINNVQ